MTPETNHVSNYPQWEPAIIWKQARRDGLCPNLSPLIFSLPLALSNTLNGATQEASGSNPTAKCNCCSILSRSPLKSWSLPTVWGQRIQDVIGITLFLSHSKDLPNRVLIIAISFNLRVALVPVSLWTAAVTTRRWPNRCRHPRQTALTGFVSRPTLFPPSACTFWRSADFSRSRCV